MPTVSGETRTKIQTGQINNLTMQTPTKYEGQSPRTAMIQDLLDSYKIPLLSIASNIREPPFYPSFLVYT